MLVSIVQQFESVINIYTYIYVYICMYIPSHLSLHPLPPSHPSGLSQRSRLGSLLFSNFPRNSFTHAAAAAAAAKSLQSCPTLCNPIDGSPPGSPVPGILQARTLEWVAISFSNSWKWKVKVKSLSRVRLLATPWTAAYKAPPSMGFSRQEYWSGVPSPSAIYVSVTFSIHPTLTFPRCVHRSYATRFINIIFLDYIYMY